MPNPNAIVGLVSHFDPPYQPPSINYLNASPTGVTVYFQSKETAQLDSNNPNSTVYAEILDELQQINAPVYVEVDPTNQAINRLFIPLVVRVVAVVPYPSGDVEIELEISHARHFLRSKNPDYNQLLNALQTAQADSTSVIVTETDNHEIIDVRPAPSPFDLAPLVSIVANLNFALRTVTPQRAKQLFDEMNNKTCEPRTVPSPCIPFMYPDDGCWGRAHEMCRLIIAQGEQPGKVWIYGRLKVKTKNNPNCEVQWGYHVAPTLQIAVGGATQLQVIDPSIFPQPVDEATWKGVQGDPNATLVDTDASVYYRSPSGVISTDPTYSETNRVLATYRLQLKNRSSSVGPPPYRNCP